MAKFKEIIKRDGRKVKFSSNKLTKCLKQAGEVTNEFSDKIAEKLTIRIINLVSQVVEDRLPTVEDVQDCMEEVLLSSTYKETAKACIIYREQHNQLREITSEFNSGIIKDYLKKNDWKVNENSNQGFSLQGLNNYVSSEVTKTYWLNKIYPKEIRDAHNSGELHIHDLSYLSAYCVSSQEHIITCNGSKVANSIKVGDKLIGFDGTGFKPTKVVKVFSREVEDILEIKFEYFGKNKKLRVTGEHPFLTTTGWKEAKLLNVGDEILTATPKDLFSFRCEYGCYKDRKELLSMKEARVGLNIKRKDKFFVENWRKSCRKAQKKLRQDKKLLWKDKTWVESMMQSRRDSGMYQETSERMIKNNSMKNKRVSKKAIKTRTSRGTGFFETNNPMKDPIKKKEIMKKAMSRHLPSNPEKRVIKIIKENRLPIYYVGKADLFIGRYNPDFVDESGNKLIEVFTTKMFDKNRTPDMLKKKEYYAGRGKKCLLLNTDILSDNQISKKLRSFISNGAKVLKIKKLFSKQQGKRKYKFKVVNFHCAPHNNFVVNGLITHNCVGWDLYDLLLSGFKGVVTKTESKPAKHFATCLGQLNNFFFTLAGEAAGAQAFSNLDTLLAPFIRYDKLSYKEVKQYLQEFIFNLNVPTRVGFQAPFSNITLDLEPSPNYVDKYIVIGGELQKEKYKDFQEEMNMFNKAFFEVLLEGDATGKVFTFPIPTYSITKDFDWDNPMLEGLWEMTSKYGIPYFCLEKSTLVYTNNGVKPIGNITLDDMVIGSDGKYKKIKNIFPVIHKKGIKVNTKLGNIVSAENHQFPTKDGVKKIKDITLSDKFIVDNTYLEFENGFKINNFTKEYFDLFDEKNNKIKLENLKSMPIFCKLKPKIKTKIQKLKPFKYVSNRFQTTLKNIKIPLDLNEDICELIGQLIGDGSFRKNGVSLTNADREIIDFFVTKMKSIFGVTSTISKAGESKICKSIGINSVILVGFLKYIGVKRANCWNKEIPTILYNRTEKEIGAFLRGLFDTDGSCLKNKSGKTIISITLMNLKLISQVSELLSMLNIVGRLENNHIVITGNRNIELFSKKIGFRIKRKKNNINILKEFNKPSRGYKIVSKIEAINGKYGEHYKYKKENYFRVKRYESNCFYLFCKKLEKTTSEQEISSISKINTEIETIDIEIESSDNLFLLFNNIFTHNSNFVNSDMKPEDSRSMCCFNGKHEINFKINDSFKIMPLQKIISRYKEIEVLQNGEWVKAKTIKIDYDKPFIKVILRNGLSYNMTDNHINPTQRGNIFTKDLVIGDKLKYSHSHFEYEGVGSYNLGKFIGYYLAEGSSMGTFIQFSIGETETNIADFISKISSEYFGCNTSIMKNTGKSLTVAPQSDVIKMFIDKHISGKATDKHLKNYYSFNHDMLRGIWDGWFEGDGGKSEVYTSSKQLAYQMINIARILGIKINLRTTENEEIFAFGKTYIRNLYTLHICKEKDNGGRIYDNGFVEIIDIKKVSNRNKVAFCVEVATDAPYFELSDGLYTHNCRLRLDTKQLEKRGGGLFGANPLTGSIGVVTINLPRIAYLSTNKKEFFDKLERLMFLAKESLEIKRKIVEKFTENDLYPYTKFYIRKVKERFGEYWKNHFSTIGLIGMNEVCLNFLKEDIGSKNGVKFTEETLVFMRNKLVEFQKDTGNNYNLEATPAESTAYKLAKGDKEEFEDIIVSNEEEYKKGAEPYYTNSTQLPVGYSDSIVDVLDLQDSIQTKYTGGCIEENSLVMTDKGLIKIKDIVKNKNIEVYSFNEKTKKTELKAIKDAFYINVEEKNKLQIELEGNNNIITSSWHPFYVLDENLNIVTKRADELKKNDFVISITNNVKPKNEISINCDIAWLYGEFITDGYVSNHYIGFYSCNKDTIKKIENILTFYIGKTYKKYKDRDIRIYKKDIKHKIEKMLYLDKYGAKTFTCLLHPDTLNFSYENKIALLAGIIDGDGNVPVTGKYIRICSASLNFVLSLMSLLYSLGLTASYKKDKDNLYYVFIRKEQYSKILNTLKKHLSYKNKASRLKKYIDSNGKKGIICTDKIKDLATYKYTTGKYKTKNKISLSLAKQINTKLKNISGYFVKKITKPKVKTKFCDLTVEGNNNYLAGNNALVFIHNTVLHLFIGESRPSNESIKNLVNKICNKYKLPYFTISPTFSTCPSHGYIFGEFHKCPKCNSDCEVYSRVVGYLRPISQWNKGKKQEFQDRKLFKI